MNYDEYASIILDNQDVICYISDPNTYELLYASKTACQLFKFKSHEEYRGKKCYEVIQQKDSPCEFCTNALLKPKEKYCWEYFNPIINSYMALTDTLVEVNGKLLRMEIAQDVSEQKKQISNLQNKLSTEQTLVRCIQTLASEQDTDIAINTLLKIVSDFYKSSRVYIFEFDYKEKIIKNTYEWCAEGVSRQIDNLQKIPLEYVDGWCDKFRKDGEFFITSVHGDLDPASPEYQILEPQGLESLIAAPIISKNGVITGFIGVDDPTVNADDMQLLKSVSYFYREDLYKRRILERLETLSYKDMLTGLYNRNKYIHEIEKYDDGPPESMGIVFVDINGMKTANDTYGHRYGDQMIINTAKLITKYFGENVFRVGGDEFVALCPNMPKNVFTNKVSAIRKKASNESVCTISIGSLWKTGDFVTSEEIHNADELMYADKQDYYRYSFTHDRIKHTGIANQVITEIAGGEFLVYMQPKIELKSGKISGAEALVRKQKKDGTLIPPIKFIPLYEAKGIIRHVDYFVLETVCKTLQQWNTQRINLPISVNFSRVTLLESDFVKNIKVICEKFDILPEQIDIEITESISKMDSETLSELVGSIINEGFSVSLDDFGSQYSNLAILTAMDFTQIKFDKSIVDNIETNEKSRIVLKNAIEMCNSFPNTSSLAEGIENKEQYEMLKNYNCDFGQGYYFSKPIPTDDFLELYKNSENKPLC